MQQYYLVVKGRTLTATVTLELSWSSLGSKLALRAALLGLGVSNDTGLKHSGVAGSGPSPVSLLGSLLGVMNPFVEDRLCLWAIWSTDLRCVEELTLCPLILLVSMYDWDSEPLNVQLSELLLSEDKVELFPVVVDVLEYEEIEVSLNWLIRPRLWVPPIEVSTMSGSNLTPLGGCIGLSANKFSLFSITRRKFLENFLSSSSLGSFTFSLPVLVYALILGLDFSCGVFSAGMVTLDLETVLLERFLSNLVIPVDLDLDSTVDY